MTITVAFLCRNGAVLGADSQETYEGSALKRIVPKLVILPPLQHLSAGAAQGIDRRAIFTGSGHGPLIDKLIDEIWNEIETAPPSLDDMQVLIDERIKQIYKGYRQTYHPGYMPNAELVYAIWCGGAIRLFHAVGPIVNAVGTKSSSLVPAGYKATGMGSEITDYIAKRMYDEAMPLSRAAVLASFMLQQAVEHAEGCGSDIYIALLHMNGTVEHYDVPLLHLTRMLRNLDRSVGKLMLLAADWRKSEKAIDALWTYLRKQIAEYRRQQISLLRTEEESKREMMEMIEDVEEAQRRAEQDEDLGDES